MSHCCSLSHLRCPTASHSGAFAFFHMSHCCSLDVFMSLQTFPFSSLGWLCFLSDVSLMLTIVGPRLIRCNTAASTGGSLSFQVSHCHFSGWFCVAPGVSLLFTGVTRHGPWCYTSAHLVSPCHLSCPTASHLGDSTSSQLSHCS